jgi:hypothetical protein
LLTFPIQSLFSHSSTSARFLLTKQVGSSDAYF